LIGMAWRAPAPRRLAFWRRLSLRARLVALGTLGLALGLGFGGLLLIGVSDHVLGRSVDLQARQTGEDVARLVNEQALPNPAPVAGGQLVQVVDADHRVRSASVNADRLVPLLRESEIPKVRSGEITYVPGERAGLTGPLRVVVVPAGSDVDPQVVIVARSVADVQRGADVVQTALIVVYPLLLAVMAGAGWRVAGGVLRPVEALRVGAERITAAPPAAAERLPVPPSRDEIHRLAVTLNRMLDRLAVAQHRQRAFVADAAHELRSPLASMRTQIEVAQRLSEPSSEDAELLCDLLVDVDRLSRLVADLLTLARADAPVASAATEPVELTTLLSQISGRYQAARVMVEVVPSPPAWVVADPDGLERIFTNLLDNAVRHADHRVVASVAAAVGGDGAAAWLVAVVDDGPGIPPADRERAFDRFTRLDHARSRHDGGTGLGLAIVRELVRAHGGTVALGEASGTDPASGLRAEVLLSASDLDSALDDAPDR
jgi:signal transduction histidine kinase